MHNAILIVEKDEAVLEKLRRLLGAWFDVKSAVRPEAGLAKGCVSALVRTDTSEDFAGLAELCKSGVPVIAYSADKSAGAKALSMGAAGFVNVNQAEIEAEAIATQESSIIFPMIKALRDSENVCMYIKDANLKYVTCSRAYASLFGKSEPESFEGKRAGDMFDPEIAKMHEAGDRRLMDSGRPTLDRVVRMDTGDTVRYMRVSQIPLYGENGTVLGIMGISRDITSAHDTAAQLKLLTENIPGGIITLEVGERVKAVYYNEGLFAFTGYSAEEFHSIMESDPLNIILEEDRASVKDALQHIREGADSFYCAYRCMSKSGEARWLDMRGEVTERVNGVATVCAVQFDVTHRREAEELLRVSGEKFRIAAEMGGRSMASYNIKTGQYHHYSKKLTNLGYAPDIAGMPQTLIDNGIIAENSIAEYLRFFDGLKKDGESPSADIQVRDASGGLIWLRLEASVVKSVSGEPDTAIIVYSDVTAQREKEAVYKKWRMSLSDKPLESYTMFSLCVMGRPIAADDNYAEGTLISMERTEGASFNQVNEIYASQRVLESDRQEYINTLNTDRLLASYLTGERVKQLDYRELPEDGGERWRRVTIEMVGFENSADVQAFVLYEDIDAAKRAEIQTYELANSDPLTGVSNRAAFTREVEEILKAQSGLRHALFMIDFDGFKLLNDTKGHQAGDQELIEAAKAIAGMLRPCDLLGRMGGDEFAVLINDAPYNADIAETAERLCSLTRRTIDGDAKISASVGISVYPDDGINFDTLYRNADAALYRVKEAGGDSFTFYSGQPPIEATAANQSNRTRKRRMLIADDNAFNCRVLESIFDYQYDVRTVHDGNAALIYLRHYGASVSVVLLDLMMPGIDGFAVLSKMRTSPEMQNIPVVVVSGMDEGDAALKAIKGGASDFVAKPYNPDLVRLRVESAISKTENERLRAQNSYLQLRSSEESKYRVVLESISTAVIEYNWVDGVFTYDPSLETLIAGKFDGRKLWHILLSDMVADVMDVQHMQQLVHEVASDRKNAGASIDIKLKTPSGARHPFHVNVFKHIDEHRLTDQVMITLTDMDENALANERLRYQAERDDLTGLYNRTTFIRKAGEMVQSSPDTAFAIATGDVDGLKLVNDRYGLAEGDALLKHIADVLARDTGAAGGICGRLSNDVFAALLPMDAGRASEMENFPKRLMNNYPLGLEISFSVGYYLVDNREMTVESMLDRATIAKNTVKRSYTVKTAWYDDLMRKSLLREQEIVGSMDAAMNSGMFDIYLQPQIDHSTGAICGAEALVRWLHPDKGVVYFPGEFIPLFEQNGFVTKLDEYIWRRTVEVLRIWLDEGRRVVPISVNVSRLDTHDSQLCERLVELVEKSGIPMNLLRLEITESLFEENPERLIMVVDKLHEAGFIIEMDDFGSGYSSLNILKDVRVDVLKLDMRFFLRTDNRKRSGLILNAIMRMARWLDIRVVAEGVETREQADYLSSIGCKDVQGYLYARPMPVADFERLIDSGALGTEKWNREGNLAPDTGELWDIGSRDSQLFNNYMDAAMIFEYCDGEFEVTRINRRYCELMDFSLKSGLPKGIPLGMREECITAFREATERAADTGRDVAVTVRRESKDGDDITLRCSLRLMPNDAERAVLLCSIELEK